MSLIERPPDAAPDSRDAGDSRDAPNTRGVRFLAWLMVVVALGLFAFSLLLPSSLTVAVAILLAGISALVIAAKPMATVGTGLVVAFAFTSSWDDVTLGGIKPRQLFLVFGLLLLILGYGINHPPRIPWWINVFGAASLISTVGLEFFRVDANYINSRYLTSEAGQALLTRPGALPSQLSFLVNIYIVPSAVVLACRYNPRAMRWIIYAFVSGVALSSMAGYLGFEGQPFLLTATHSLVPPAGTRALGFASHPLHLATSEVFAVGLACWMGVQKGFRARWIGRLDLILILLGSYASGSRGGNGAVLLIIALSVFVLPTIRRRIHTVVAVAAVLLAVVIVTVPAVGLAILKTTRLYGGTTNAVSDTGRSQVLDQGIQDFKHSPVLGIGLRYISEAHTLYAGVFASGGVVLALAFILFQLGSLRDLARSLFIDRPLGGALLATLVGSLAYWSVADELGVADVFIVYGLVIAFSCAAADRLAELDGSADGSPAPEVMTVRAGATRLLQRSSDTVPS